MPKTPSLIVTALLAGLLLTACSSSSPTTGAASGTPSGPSSSSADSPAADSPAADPTDPCSLVSVDKANAVASPDPVFTQTEKGALPDGEPECGYASADSATVILNVTLFADPSGFDLSKGVVSDAALSSVSGVGDRAAFGGPELDIVAGSRGIVIESFGSTDLSKDQLVAMGKAVVAALR